MGDEKSVIINDNNSVKAIELRPLEAKDPKAMEKRAGKQKS